MISENLISSGGIFAIADFFTLAKKAKGAALFDFIPGITIITVLFPFMLAQGSGFTEYKSSNLSASRRLNLVGKLKSLLHCNLVSGESSFTWVLISKVKKK